MQAQCGSVGFTTLARRMHQPGCVAQQLEKEFLSSIFDLNFYFQDQVRVLDAEASPGNLCREVIRRDGSSSIQMSPLLYRSDLNTCCRVDEGWATEPRTAMTTSHQVSRCSAPLAKTSRGKPSFCISPSFEFAWYASFDSIDLYPVVELTMYIWNVNQSSGNCNTFITKLKLHQHHPNRMTTVSSFNTLSQHSILL